MNWLTKLLGPIPDPPPRGIEVLTLQVFELADGRLIANCTTVNSSVERTAMAIAYGRVALRQQTGKVAENLGPRGPMFGLMVQQHFNAYVSNGPDVERMIVKTKDTGETRA